MKGIKKITENVYAMVGYEGCNVACINTKEGMILVDTPTFLEGIEDLKAFLSGLDPEGVRYIINTHIHFDHIIGNNRIGGKVIMHQMGGDRLFQKGATQRETLTETTPVWPKEDVDFILNEPLVRPGITMDRTMTIHLGGLSLEIRHTGGHTPDSVMVYVVDDRVLMTGDNLTAGLHPFRGEASFSDWIKALEQMRTYDIDFIIPGHGEVCGKKEIDRYIEYFRRQYDLAMAMVQEDRSREEVVDAVREELFGFFEVEPVMEKVAGKMFDKGTARLYEEIRGNLLNRDIK